MFKTIITISSILLLQACSEVPVKKMADVTSAPSGAVVYANNSKLGVTPLYYKLYDAFPAGWKNSAYQAEGVLVVKKDGCLDFSLDVNDSVISEPIHATLECDLKKSEKTSEVDLSEIERRLKKVEYLYNKKLTTEDEYNSTRERILNEL